MYLLDIELKDFSAAHRLVKGYVGKCNHLHGHNYSVEIVLASKQLNENDLVIDFSEVRQISNQWIQSHLDHSTLVYSQDFPLLEFVKIQQQKHFVMAQNTTVECLANVIYDNLTHELKSKKQSVQQVRLSESKQCSVVYSGQ